MVKGCVFCEVVSGIEPCYRLYESESVLVILDLSPLNPGHVLVLPKAHIVSLVDLSSELSTEIMDAVKESSRVISASYRPLKVGMLVAGFDYEHLHFHVAPLYEREDMATRRVWDKNFKRASDESLQKVHEMMIAQFDAAPVQDNPVQDSLVRDDLVTGDFVTGDGKDSKGRA